MTETMQGKIVMVTGATSGIGEVTALELARQGAHVVIVSRSEDKCAATVTEIKQQTGNQNVDYIVADLSDMQQVRQAAQQFKLHHDRLDVLVNNAGGVFASRQESPDGYELTFALNHLNYFLLTNLLLDVLKASAPARIVNVSSDAHRGATLDFDDLQAIKSYRAFRAYSRSKLMNILFTYELAKRLEGTGVTVNVLHPGFVSTGFGRNNNLLWKLMTRVVQVFALNPEEGAATSIYLASSPEVEGVTGKYFVKCEATPSSNASYDESAMRWLWEVSADLVGLKAQETESG